MLTALYIVQCIVYTVYCMCILYNTIDCVQNVMVYNNNGGKWTESKCIYYSGIKKDWPLQHECRHNSTFRNHYKLN